MDNDKRLQNNIYVTALMVERIINTEGFDTYRIAAHMKGLCKWDRVRLALETIDRIFDSSVRSGPLFVRCYDVWPNVSLADMALLANFMIQRENIITTNGRAEFVLASSELQPTSDHPIHDLLMGLRDARRWNEYMARRQIKVTCKRLDEHMRQDNDGECRMCQESIALGTKVSVLPCGHWYCQVCIGEWFKTNTTCPTCRRDIYRGHSF